MTSTRAKTLEPVRPRQSQDYADDAVGKLMRNEDEVMDEVMDENGENEQEEEIEDNESLGQRSSEGQLIAHHEDEGWIDIECGHVAPQTPLLRVDDGGNC